MNRSTRLKLIETQKLSTLAIPAIIAQLAQAGLGVIDTIMAGHHSAEALAAIAIGANIFTPVIVFIVGIMLVLNPLVAQLNGEKDYKQLAQVFHNGMFLGLILAAPSALLLQQTEWLLTAIGTDKSLIPLTTGYLDALCWGLPSLYLFFALRFTNEGLFGNKIIMYIALSTLPLNVLANQWFIYGGFGLEPMGAVGVGWATNFVYSYMFITLLIITAKTKNYRHLELFSRWHKPDWQVIKHTLKIGIPMGMSIGLEVALFAAVGLMISTYTIHQIAGHQVALNISTMCYMIPLGLSTAITARVSFHIGSGQPQRAKIAGWSGIGMALVIMSCSVMMLLAFPEGIVSVYSKDTGVMAVAIQLLLFCAMFQLSDGTQVASAGALRGLKDTKVPMYFSALSYWVIGFPLGYYLAEHQQMGIDGYWIALITALTIAATLMLLRFRLMINRQSKRPKQVLSH